jgi:protease I
MEGVKPLLLCIIVLLSGCVQQQKIEVEQMPSVEGKSVLMVIAPEGFRDEEFFEPKSVFKQLKIDVTVASKGVKTAKGKLGGSAEVDKDISAVEADDYDAVVFIGGPGTSVYFEDSTALNLAKEAYESEKVVAAICIAPSILANAGILHEKKATCFSSESSNLQEQGAEYTGSDVEIDGKIITANGPAAAKKFALEIAKALED